jgi:hypothetical protein
VTDLFPRPVTWLEMKVQIINGENKKPKLISKKLISVKKLSILPAQNTDGRI